MKKFKLLTSVSLVLCLVFQLAGFHVPPFGITDVYAASSGIVDGNDTSIYYAGNWSEVSNQNYYNGSTKVSSRLADFVYFTFTGTEFTWIGTKGNNMGIARIHVDNITQPIVDLYSPTQLYQQELFKITGLPYGEHEVLIDVIGNKNPSSSGYNVDIDAFKFGGMPISQVNNGFLVVVASGLYNISSVKTAIDAYVDDTINIENYNTKLITVNTVPDATADYICETPSKLKTVIKDHYDKGYVGFVLIGSSPYIPTPYVVANGDGAGSVYPSDLFYADMDDWGQQDSYGRYSEATVGNLYKYAPEMFYGRISAAGSTNGSLYAEAIKVIDYLNKLHDFRINQGNLTPEQNSRSLVLKDDDWSMFKENNTMSNLGTEMYTVYDNSLSSSETLVSELQRGYKFIYECFHSSNIKHYIDEYSNDQCYTDTSFDYNVVRSINPKVNYINLFNCSSCKNIDSNDNPMDNLGEAYLLTAIM
ncbi:C25 family cysteine peptidase [Acetivibrio mesophilus]|uniref:Gingipain domain-containing protein n=1 Tax=Acetivibrio mesophilus TaxID=2487273 RepID=A0A4Q0IAK2_9FIRM|nr:C25 family cysteine peptidase [Acetivibrio mesophilus]ODM25477.1 hypothetical protein A7W90_04110 [Clostridium sp. Bc-iso-3]RXE60092.1 hypothetical protein EFD62_02325 [Acetivibrio mesophilus]HHV30767.1 hypothetical protein [Clostridium sp.]